VFMSRFLASARFGHAQASVRRGEPVQFQGWVRDFSRNRSRRAAMVGRTAIYSISEYWNNATDLPDVSSCALECRRPPATLHGVVLDILRARTFEGSSPALVREQGRSMADS
jgi:hypothetical protein